MSPNRPHIAAATMLAAALTVAPMLPATLDTAWAQEQTAARKLGRGAANIGLGVLEIPGNMYQTGQTSGVVAGATLGLGLGTGKFVARELVGVYELLSAPFAVPAGFQPILQPEWPWGYFNKPEGQAYGFRDPYLAEQAAEIGAITGAVVTRRGSVLVVEFPKRLHFDSDSSSISLDGQARLTELAAVLDRYPQTTVAVRGYTDNTGNRKHNLELSSNRAKAVGGYLVSRGVAASRVVSSGRADADPIGDNATEAGRERNRRVEIEIRTLPEPEERSVVGGTRPN